MFPPVSKIYNKFIHIGARPDKSPPKRTVDRSSAGHDSVLRALPRHLIAGVNVSESADCVGLWSQTAREAKAGREATAAGLDVASCNWGGRSPRPLSNHPISGECTLPAPIAVDAASPLA